MLFETGQTVPESGRYENAHGTRVILQGGDTFPPCPDHNGACKWAKAGTVINVLESR
ncbi:MAG: YjzC family protein [Bacillota bacterium]